MPNILNANGLQTKTIDELRQEIFGKLRLIYGADINLGSESPDTQNAMIYVQECRDILDMIVDAFNSFDPDQAVGLVLDMRVGLNGIQRKAGTNTIISIRVETDSAVQLYGVDQDIEDVFTIADDAGTQFVLGQSITIPSAGFYDLIFQSEEVGQIEVQLNTITEIVTVTLGVISVNNPSPPISTGINEETDVELRQRRLESVAIAGQGWKDSLTAMLRNINGISVAEVFENKTGQNPDSRGIPDHSIWVLISGVYSDAEVANAIYVKRNAGAGMKGNKSYTILDDDGNPDVMRWDDVSTEPLYIQMTVQPIDPTLPINIDAIRSGLSANMKFSINGTVNANGVSCQIQGIDPNALVTAIGFSHLSTGPFIPVIKNTTLNKIFVLESDNVIVLPMDILPKNSSTTGGVSPAIRQFKAYGGFGTYTWSVQVDNSGVGGSPATIDSNGVYTPGTGSVGVYDTIQVEDSKGNIVSTQIEVLAP